MAYLPPSRHALTLPLGGGTPTPDRHALALHLNPDIAAARTAQGQSGDAVARFIAAIHATATTAQGQTADLQGRALFSKRLVATQARDAWQQAAARDLETRVPWRNGTATDAQRQIHLDAAQASDHQTRLRWQASQAVDAERSVRGHDAIHHLTRDAGLRWRNAQPQEVQRRSHWQHAMPRDGEPQALPYRNPPVHDVQRTARWQVGAPRDHQTWLAVGRATARDHQRRLPWGVADAVRWAYLIPPPAPPTVPAPAFGCYTPPGRHGLRLRLAGGYMPLNRHALGIALVCDRHRRFDLRETLHMSHSLSVVRLPDRLPLAVKSVSLSADRDSWSWSAQLGFADAASLLAVEPTPSGLASVEITLDGHVFTAQVEGYTEDRRFAQRGGSVSGRSRTVQLASPNVPERAYTNPEPATAQQLALRELAFTDFALDWQIDDWLVPAGAWAYDRATPISAITLIAAAAGAMLQSAPGSDTLVVAPRLPALPWAFDAETPDFALAGGSWLSKGKRWNGGSRYNGVYISGREQGVLANVYRDGTAGSPYAPLVVDPLITSIEPARGRGGQILADSLPRHEIPIELPLTAAGSAPGLLLPGELGQIEDVVWGHYRAVVDSVQITAEVSAQGLVTARQSASLWRYLP